MIWSALGVLTCGDQIDWDSSGVEIPLDLVRRVRLVVLVPVDLV
ncbi:hypothetical protein [Streptacidiphilus albus]|nr:hypothetical protein [Streptacidiphilus albus]